MKLKENERLKFTEVEFLSIDKSKYHDLADRIVEAKHGCVKIEKGNLCPGTVYYGLRRKLPKGWLVFTIKKEVYVQKPEAIK